MIETLNKLLRLPEKLPDDKRIHLIMGSVIMSLMLTVGIIYWIAFPILIVIAWGLEFYQKYTKSGQYDNWDAVAVVIGGIIVALPFVA